MEEIFDIELLLHTTPEDIKNLMENCILENNDHPAIFHLSDDLIEDLSLDEIEVVSRDYEKVYQGLKLCAKYGNLEEKLKQQKLSDGEKQYYTEHGLQRLAYLYADRVPSDEYFLYLADDYLDEMQGVRLIDVDPDGYNTMLSIADANKIELMNLVSMYLKYGISVFSAEAFYNMNQAMQKNNKKDGGGLNGDGPGNHQ